MINKKDAAKKPQSPINTSLKPICLAMVTVLSFSATAQADEEKIIEEVVSYGTYSGSLARAMDIKQGSDNVVDAISAEDIGKFPSSNVAEALQLVPGVQIARDRGEGLGVSVRGLGPNFQTTQLNGRNIAINENVENSGQNGRQFRYDVLPSDLIAGLEVVKSPSASMEEGAIGGQVNIKTFKPLDLGNSASATAQVSHSDLSDSMDPRLSGIYSWVNENEDFGLLVSAAYSDREIRQDRVFTFNWIQGALNAATGETADLNQAFAPQRNRPTLERQDRNRQSLAAALQWQSSDNHEMNIDLLWSQFNVAFDEIGIDIELGGEVQNPVVVGDSLLAGKALGTNLQLSRESSESEHANLTLAMNNTWTWDDWRVSTDISLSNADSETVAPIRRTRIRLTDQAVDFDYSAGFEQAPSFSFPVDISDSSNFPGRRIEYRTIDVSDSDNALKLDIEHTLSGVISSVEFGVNIRQREREYNRRDIRVSDGIDGVFFSDDYFENFPVSDFASNVSGNYPSEWAVPKESAYFSDFFASSLLEQPLTAGDKRNSYVVEENVYAGYVQSNIESTAGLPVFGNIGLRMVRTEQNPSGTSVIDDSPQAVAFENAYNELLPSANINFELSDEVILRTAFAKVMTRPSLPDLRPGLTFSTDAPTASGGNPLLNPYQALQYDLSLEWYFDQDAYVSAGLFYKDITTFISKQAQMLDVNGTDVILSAPFNTGKGDITGLEIAYQQVFSSLPAPFNGLGVQANYTYVDSQVEVTQDDVLVAQPIAGLSENSSNFVVFYEYEDFGARIGYNWRDAFLVSNGVGTVADQYQDAFGTLDMNVTYTLSNSISLSVEAVNLTDESIKTYFDDKQRGGRIDHYGKRVALGVNVKF
ncbi:TonB-dependent receptor [Catenovulum adriaticum]|uniref:TonB-dependent receptor n=1 Tax=Catenovulum adriaticum TaxID=2984846 RepID=A0ABY7AUA9_9ALTE|nr:TonB-dependent receptor [Catenovulum sp. TS8]WAJ71861.1 TonB-dependent receptor [Catenovulum sp. TS8]